MDKDIKKELDFLFADFKIFQSAIKNIQVSDKDLSDSEKLEDINVLKASKFAVKMHIRKLQNDYKNILKMLLKKGEKNV